MKRGQPLQRRTPLQARTGLKRGSSRLETRTPLKGSNLQGGGPQPASPRTPLKPRSEKRQADMVERRALVKRLLAERPTCEARWACRGARAVDVHERLKRSRGGSILDPVQAHMVTLCRACHAMTEAQPAEATRRRMLFPSWHVCPPVGPC